MQHWRWVSGAKSSLAWGNWTLHPKAPFQNPRSIISPFRSNTQNPEAREVCEFIGVPALTPDAFAQLNAMQQYSVAPLGYAPLQQWAEQHMRAMHSPPPGVSYNTTITNGSNSALEVRH